MGIPIYFTSDELKLIHTFLEDRDKQILEDSPEDYETYISLMKTLKLRVEE